VDKAERQATVQRLKDERARKLASKPTGTKWRIGISAALGLFFATVFMSNVMDDPSAPSSYIALGFALLSIFNVVYIRKEFLRGQQLDSGFAGMN
jgi:hypothetical protein